MSVVFHLVLGKEQSQNEGKIFISTALLVIVGLPGFGEAGIGGWEWSGW